MSSLHLIANGTSCVLPVDVALELARRLRRLRGTFESPAQAAAILIEACCHDDVPCEVSFTDREEVELAWAVHAWLCEVGSSELPAPVQTLRDALNREAA